MELATYKNRKRNVTSDLPHNQQPRTRQSSSLVHDPPNGWFGPVEYCSGAVTEVISPDCTSIPDETFGSLAELYPALYFDEERSLLK